MARDYTPNDDKNCPVPKATLVDVIFKSGALTKHMPASRWMWEDCGSDYDIVFWRISKVAKENK